MAQTNSLVSVLKLGDTRRKWVRLCKGVRFFSDTHPNASFTYEEDVEVEIEETFGWNPTRRRYDHSEPEWYVTSRFPYNPRLEIKEPLGPKREEKPAQPGWLARLFGAKMSHGLPEARVVPCGHGSSGHCTDCEYGYGP